jgi:subtilisin-like proprotein convertase family protein
VWIETVNPNDIDLYLESPAGTRVELVTDRASSSAFDILDATFDDAATDFLPTTSTAEPYTGIWKPEDPLGLAKLNGENALGTWRLNVIDDSTTESFGARLVKWRLNINAGFSGPETFAGTASDVVGAGGIQSVVLTDPDNVQLNLPPGFIPGDPVVQYTVTLIDSTLNGSGTVLVTDTSNNTCTSAVTLNGFVDTAGPSNTAQVTRDLMYGAEVQANVPPGDFNGVVSTLNVSDTFMVGEVEVDLTVDAKDLGRMAAKLTHAGEFASLINRVGMEERASAGLTKPVIEVTLDDDAPVADDAHLEPALGTIPFLGLHQPDGRGDYFGDGITSDTRENMLLQLGGLNAAGSWEMLVGDFRLLSPVRSTFRRWAMTLKNPCGPEYYVGTARDASPGTGIATIALATGATNLTVLASFAPGAEAVDYRVALVDPTQPGSGTLKITDVAGNITTVPIGLAAASPDVNLPVISGGIDPETLEFEGTATDNQAGDSGIASVTLTPWSDNLQIVSLSPDPPNGAGSVTFVVGRINPLANGRGYVRVTDTCGWRSHVLVDIDGLAPLCAGSRGHTKRYLSTDLPQAIPDNNAAGVSSSIVVSDVDVVSDVNITFNITHAFDDDIDMTLTSPQVISLLSDIGNLGNDFIDTTLDDEAAAPIPDLESEVPFTGSYQPEAGPALFVLDGVPANGTYILKVVDDKLNDTGTFESWSLTITSATFPERYDGRAEDGAPLDSGICSITLLPATMNLVLTSDPFDPGDAIVRYSVALTAPTITGFGTVRVTDCAGNLCEVPVALGCAHADYDADGDLDIADYDTFLFAFGTTSPTVDLDGDGIVTLQDYQLWLACYRDYVGNPLADPPVHKKPRPWPGPEPQPQPQFEAEVGAASLAPDMTMAE